MCCVLWIGGVNQQWDRALHIAVIQNIERDLLPGRMSRHNLTNTLNATWHRAVVVFSAVFFIFTRLSRDLEVQQHTLCRLWSTGLWITRISLNTNHISKSAQLLLQYGRNKHCTDFWQLWEILNWLHSCHWFGVMGQVLGMLSVPPLYNIVRLPEMYLQRFTDYNPLHKKHVDTQTVADFTYMDFIHDAIVIATYQSESNTNFMQSVKLSRIYITSWV